MKRSKSLRFVEEGIHVIDEEERLAIQVEMEVDTKSKCCVVIGFERSIIVLIVWHVLTVIFALVNLFVVRKHEIMK